MAASIVVASISEGRVNDWKAFASELTGERRTAWAESQRRRGITREVVFLSPDDPGPAAVYLIEGAEAGDALAALESSDEPFDQWYRDRLADLHDDLDLPTRVYDTRPSPGAWRGWRGWLGRKREVK